MKSRDMASEDLSASNSGLVRTHQWYLMNYGYSSEGGLNETASANLSTVTTYGRRDTARREVSTKKGTTAGCRPPETIVTHHLGF